MTLIAAFKDHGTPLLIGDFLVNSNGTESGLKKKIHLICPNLVIGWTGDLIAAQVLLNDLYNELSCKRISREELERFLINYPYHDLRSFKVKLIGWVVENKPHCFMWNNENPGELYYENNHNKGICGGSGSEIFKRLAVLGGRDYVERLSLRENIDAAIGFAFNIVGKLIEDEIKGKGNNRELCFGYAYEILFYEHCHYKYVNNVLYLAWDFYLDEDGKLLTKYQHKKIYKYRTFGNYSIIGIIDVEKNGFAYEVIEPMCGRNERDRNETINQATVDNSLFSLHSDYYCIFFQINPHKNKYFIGVMTIPADLPHSPLNIKMANGVEEILIDENLIQFAYKHIERSQFTDDYNYYK